VVGGDGGVIHAWGDGTRLLEAAANGESGAGERCIPDAWIVPPMKYGWGRLDELGPPGLVFVVGGLLVAATVHTAVAATTIASAVEAAMVGMLTIAVVTRGLTLRASDRDTRDKWRIAGWCFVGTLVASILAGIMLLRAALRGNAVPDPLMLVELFAAIGAVTGLFIGGDQVRAIAAGRSSERKHTSELLEKREEERLTFLNNILRHNVLNGMNIVLGYTDALDDRLNQDEEYVERIRSRSESVVELVQNVQILVRSLSGDLAVDAVDLSSVAHAQLERAKKHHDASFHADIEPDVVVATTPFVASAIENLLTNAAVHNPSDDPTVRLVVDQDGDQGRVSVEDDGPGIPEDVVDTYFGDRAPDDQFVGEGLGLYLVDELVTTHGGTIDVETGADGTAITLSFPLTADRHEATEAPARA
jgi:signal transduction histidine kinase